MDIDPSKYVKLFSIKETPLICYYEIEERQRMGLNGLPNIEIVHTLGQWYYLKKDIARYDFPDEKISREADFTAHRAKQFERWSHTVVKDWSKASWAELMEAFVEFDQQFGADMRVMDVPIYCAHHFEPRIVQALRQNGFGDKEFDVLSHPLYETHARRRHKDILKLKAGKITKEQFKNSWAFSHMAMFEYREMDDKYFEEQFSHIGDAAKELEEAERKQRQAEKWYKALYRKLPAALKKQADLMQKLMYVRDYRFEQMQRGIFNCVSLFRAIAAHLNLSYQEIIHLTPKEIMSREIPKDLKQRIKGISYYKQRIYSGKKAQEIFNAFNMAADTNFIAGKGVSKGIVRGPAKVVTNVDQLTKIELGDIIVCDTTSPDYMYAIHKVAGIVANIGGFTSHAAIVAREFGIPCIVGANNATNIFKDGDIVELDADKGVVRKVE